MSKVITLAPKQEQTAFSYAYNEAQLSNAKTSTQKLEATYSDFSAHAICHFVEHHNVAMLNVMSFFTQRIPKGKSASDADKKVRNVALWIASQKIHTKSDGQYTGKVANKMAKRELVRIFNKVGGLSPMTKLLAMHSELVLLGEIVEKEEEAKEKTQEQKTADKAVPKTNKAMAAHSVPMQQLLKEMYKLAYGKVWVGTGKY